MARPGSFSRVRDNRRGRSPWPARRNTAPGLAIRPACDRHPARSPGSTAAWESRARRWSFAWRPAGASSAAARSAVRPTAPQPPRSDPDGARSMLARRCRRCRLARSDPVREPRADAFEAIHEQPRWAGAGEAVERARIAHEFRRNPALAQGDEELLGIGDRHTLVVFGMHDQHRRMHGVYIRHGRQHAVERITLPGSAAEFVL